MREIKFRAWDKEGKRWLDSPDYAVCNCGKISLRKPGTLEYQCTHRARYVLMQFTGLKDKNGRDIYEDDLIGIQRDDYEIALVRWGEGEWLAGLLGLAAANLFFEDKCDTIEVIGNIYENPELLSSFSTQTQGQHPATSPAPEV
jgi:hypothetical protein